MVGVSRLLSPFKMTSGCAVGEALREGGREGEERGRSGGSGGGEGLTKKRFEIVFLARTTYARTNKERAHPRAACRPF